MGIRSVIVVFLDAHCLHRVKEEIARREISLGSGGFLIMLRSKSEKLQFRSLLLHGSAVSYHRNNDAIKRD